MDRGAKKRNNWRWLTLCGLVGLAALALNVPVFGPIPVVAQGQEDVISYNTGDATQSPAAVAAYWTPEMMARAVPLDVARTGRPTRPTSAPVASGPPRVVGGEPRRGSNGADAEPGVGGGPALGGASTPQPLDGPYPGPHATFLYGPRYRTWPISTSGKLFFHDPLGGGNFQCSANVLFADASVRNALWTAGHCIANGGAAYFYDNFLFCPSYNAGGVNPALGCWGWLLASVNGDWFFNGAFTRDFGYIRLAHSGTVWGDDVELHTGGLGFAWNWARDQNWVHYGYPCVNWPCSQIVMTNTEHRYDDVPDFFGPPTNSWGSSQTPGSSGSAVVLWFNYGYGALGDWVNSNVSYYYASQAWNELQGPYYDTFVCVRLKAATGWTGTC